MPTITATIDSSGALQGAAVFDKAVSQVVKGGQQIERTLTSTVVGAFKGVGSAVVSLQGALAGLGVAFGIKSVVSASDEFITLRGRLEAVTGSAAGAENALRQLSDVSQRTRTPAGELAQQYLRIQNAMDGLKRPASDAFAITEVLAKAVKVSGISSNEAAAAMMQLSQAIASGRFQGDEFRSVAENMPIVLRLLQEQTGKTAGQLRALAADGKLTADILVRALLNSTDKINTQFAKMPQTAGDAFSLLRDQLDRTTGAIAAQSGVSEAWAKVWNELRNVVSSESFKGGLKSMADGVAWLGRSAGEAVPNLRLFLAALNEDLSKGADKAKASTWSIGDALKGTFAGDVYEGNVKAVKALGELIGDWFSGKVEQGAKALNGGLLTGLQAVAAAARDAGAVLDRGAGLKSWAAGTTVTKSDPITFAENQRVVLMRLQNDLLRAQTAHNEGLALQIKTRIQLESTVTDQMKKDDPELAKKLTGLIAINGQLERQKALSDLTKQISDLRAENGLLEAQAGTDENVTRAVEAQLAIRKAVTPEIRSLSPLLAAQLEREVLITKELELQRDKAKEAFDQGKQFGDAMGAGIKSLIIDGKNWKSVLGDVVKSFAEIILKLTVIEPLAKSVALGFQSFGGLGGLGFGTASSVTSAGGWATSVLPAFGFADGGIFKSPVTLSAPGFGGVMAESGPEAVMPLTRTAGGALGVRAMGGAGGQNVTIAPTIHIDARGADMGAADRLKTGARDLTEQLISAVRQRILSDPKFLRR